ncbi:MAG: L-threonylcarbamoyladenylate synthase [Candidatus Helarchaeota archaeon]
MVEIISQSDLEDNSHLFDQIATRVKKGGIIIFPTDTIYGLGCDPLNLEAVHKIFKIKDRMKSKGLPILADSLDNIRKIAVIPEVASEYISRYWPGKLTIILKSKGVISQEVTGTLETIAVRIPGNDFTLKLITKCGGYLIGTSANKSNAEVPMDVEEIQTQINQGIDYIINAGRVREVLPSTILDLTSNVPKILRRGAQDL